MELGIDKNIDTKLSNSSKIDETLCDSINILKNDYEKKVYEVQRQLEDFKQETRINQENIERRLEHKLLGKINEVNENLTEQMKTIYQSSQKNENMMMKKIDSIEQSIKGINENFESMTMQVLANQNPASHITLTNDNAGGGLPGENV